MTAQAHGLLVHGHLIGEDGRLGEDAGLVDGRALEHLPHPGEQLLPVLRHRLGRAGLHQLGEGLDGVQPAADILGQLPALGLPHGAVGVQGLLQDLAQVGGHRLQVLLPLGDCQHVGQAGQIRDIAELLNHAVPAQLPEMPQSVDIALGQGFVHRHHRLLRPQGGHGDKHIHLSPAYPLLHQALHRLLSEDVGPGQLHRAVQIAVVHAADLHCDVPPVQGHSGSPVAGHALNQMIFSLR